MATATVANCYFCEKLVDEEENRCHGCGEVVCEDCNLNPTLMGRHDVDEHRIDPEAEGD